MSRRAVPPALLTLAALPPALTSPALAANGADFTLNNQTGSTSATGE